MAGELSSPHARTPAGAVVAAVDGTDRDAPVLAWALDEATRRSLPLHVVTVRESLSGLVVPGDPSFAPSMATMEQLDELDGSDAIVDRAVTRCRESGPAVTVSSSRPWGTAVQALLGMAETASVVVVGGGRRGPVARFFLGSTALSVVAHARCPVVVVGPDSDPRTRHGRVVVGVDGSSDSRAALEYAAGAARIRDAELVCVTAWNVEVDEGYVVTTPGTPAWERVVARHRSALDRLLAPVREHHPGLTTRVEVVHGPRVPTLVESSTTADLLVVGSRGHGGVAGMLLGSVSQGVVREAHCPVAVITHDRS